MRWCRRSGQIEPDVAPVEPCVLRLIERVSGAPEHHICHMWEPTPVLMGGELPGYTIVKHKPYPDNPCINGGIWLGVPLDSS